MIITIHRKQQDMILKTNIKMISITEVIYLKITIIDMQLIIIVDTILVFVQIMLPSIILKMFFIFWMLISSLNVDPLIVYQ